jgi:hypothetical protein
MLSRQTLNSLRKRPGMLIQHQFAIKRNPKFESVHWWLGQQLNLHEMMPDEEKVQIPYPSRRCVWEAYIKDVQHVEQVPSLLEVALFTLACYSTCLISIHIRSTTRTF